MEILNIRPSNTDLVICFRACLTPTLQGQNIPSKPVRALQWNPCAFWIVLTALFQLEQLRSFSGMRNIEEEYRPIGRYPASLFSLLAD